MTKEATTIKRTKPRFNMELGLTNLENFSPTDQVKFYREYLNHLGDLPVLATVLKKVIQRCGSMGFLNSDLYEETLHAIIEYEKEFVETGSYNEVDYEYISMSEVVYPAIRKAVNILGIQGDNCQSTFHHRFLLNVLKDANVLTEIALAAINHAKEKFLIGEELANDLITSVVNTSDIPVTVEDDPDYNRFN